LRLSDLGDRVRLQGENFSTKALSSCAVIGLISFAEQRRVRHVGRALGGELHEMAAGAAATTDVSFFIGRGPSDDGTAAAGRPGVQIIVPA
jgi:hypothetical protein